MQIQTVPWAGPLRVNRYVPAMQYDAGVEDNAPARIGFGAPAAADTTSILNAVSIASALDTTTLGGAPAPFTMDATYGRIVRLVLSGAGTPTITIDGRDFHGQPMRETLTGNGATPVNGVKAFYTIDRIQCGAVGGTTLSVGRGGLLGLPFKAIKVLTEELDDAIVGTLGTITSPVLTDPQTATTGDPRGLYTPQSTLNGTARLTGTFLFSAGKNASGNGGLMGIKHFAA